MFTELMVYAEAPVDVLVAPPEPIECSGDMVRLLMPSSPAKARGFALAMHERAAAEIDLVRAEFWAAVYRELSADVPDVALPA
jgi:hypothetical protein